MHCSLLPGVNKLAFTVLWQMTPDGEILSHRFERSIINSCAQLAYEHAQAMIEDPQAELDIPIHGDFTVDDLRCVVCRLQPIAARLRQERFLNGALRIDQPKLSFVLNQETGKPIDFEVYKNKEAHRLIEVTFF